MPDEEILSEESGQNVMLQEAIESLRKGDRARARDILTRLLKTDQGNTMCWIWLSTAVESPKERLYCLQTALQLDPQNAAAKRGLIMLGGLPPDESVPPFPLNRPRSWEEKLTIPQEPKEQKRAAARSRSPVGRLLVILGVCVALLGVAYFGFLSPNAFALQYLNRPHYLHITITFTPTGTIFPTGLPEPTPLDMLLNSTYTPTPLYVVTPHGVDSQVNFNAGLHFFKANDYENAIKMFKQVLQDEPQATDAYYYIGEAYRMQKDYQAAHNAYQTAINIDADFAPGYLGRAIVTHILYPSEDVSSDFDNAILLDPHLVAAYIERGSYRRTHNDPNGAIADEQTALGLIPDSALAYMYLALAQIDTGQEQVALDSAIKANQIDLTLVPAYLVLAQAYIANDQIDKATTAIQVYTIYSPEDVDAYLTLATVYNAIGQYQLALDSVNHYLNTNPKSAKGFNQRGLAYLNLDNASMAELDFKSAQAYDSNFYDPTIGLARAYNAEGHPGTAYIQANQVSEPLAKTDHQKAEVFYWEAIFLDKKGDTAAAKETWRHLLQLPAEAMPEEWRNEAFLRLGIKPTKTPTLRYTLTRTPSRTPTP
jgi:tetratricopeptide (TPR) repeat protein